jgi:Holliday junction DNA helicase RuvA
MFRDLISVSGVGAATARVMLSSISPADIQQAIINGDVSRLKAVKGIGEKTAQRIIVDLKNKVGKGNFGSNAAEKAVDKTIREATDNPLDKGGGGISLEELVKRVLKNF